MGRVKVLVVDDSALIRKLLSKILESSSDIEVVGTAGDPFIARDKIKQLNPDVLTLDVEMPRMNGLTFLENLMRLRPMPVVMVSSLTERNAEVTLKALELGAIDFVAKPKADISGTLEAYADEITSKVLVASKARVQALTRPSPTQTVARKLTADAVIPRRDTRLEHTTDQIIAIGASTGGTEAIKDVLVTMPADSPPIVITQHIPVKFSTAFANRVDSLCSISVCEATDRQRIIGGHAYIAPGDQHLLVERDGAHYICRLSDGPPVNRHRPSVDVLFRSVCQNVGSNAIGAILTGMGSDGAHGLLEMKEAGAATIAQNEATSVVWGMPGAACKLDAADKVLPLEEITGHILELWTRHNKGIGQPAAN